MRDLIVTNDPVLLNYVEVLLADQGIGAFVFDTHVSFAEGSIGAFPRRLMVEDGLWRQAAQVVENAGLGAHLKSGS